MPEQHKPSLNCDKKLATDSTGLARVLDAPRIAPDSISSPLISSLETTVDRKRDPHRKTSLVITLDQARNALASLRHAEHLGLLPNRFITIDWQMGGVEDSIAATGRFLKLMRDALRKRRNQTCHIWVREDGRVVGQHTHLLIHVPPDELRWFNRSRRRWLKMCGMEWQKGVWKSCAIRGANKSPSAQTSEKTHQINVLRALRYMLKHTRRNVRQTLQLPYAPPCQLVGKRIATSQNIGKAAREACGGCQPN